MRAEQRFHSDIRPPLAFICHATEDKESFVLPFAETLRALGVRSWVDKWEIRLGDSLIRRILDEGINEADAFIPVISANSISKRWVREEIDSVTLRRIEGDLLVVPIVLKGADLAAIPLSLRHLLWISGDATDYEAIAGRIFGTDRLLQPEIGPFPLQIEWEPDIGNGLYGASVVRGGFIPWIELSHELRTGVLPRVDNMPSDAIPVVESFGDKVNWVVRIRNSAQELLGDAWVGQDPSRGYIFTGLIHVRMAHPVPGPMATFQRYSDGFYRIVD